MMNILFLAITTIVILVGLVGIFVPVLPGTWLVFAGTLLYAWVTNFQVISIGYIILFAALAALAAGIDYIASLLTAKKYGASKYGLIGSVVLGVIGLIVFSIPGLIIGQLLGVILGELYFGKEMKSAVKSGIAVFIGYLLGNSAKIILTSIIVVIFYLKVLTF
ncbi:MAG: hypothetical protein K0R80_578 [Clostridia bacterium]|jgi:uncharacterized protein YqgC (DUF456 family)|nr:hypothetical protein [Clostridia bacterium]